MTTSDGPYRSVPLDGEHDVRTATRLLDEAERAAGVPLLDEAEAHRLARWRSTCERPTGWQALLLCRDDEVIAYAGVAAGASDDTATGDVAVARPVRDAQEATCAALLAARDAATAFDVARLQVWMRAVGPAEVAAAEVAGFDLERRLAVLGRGLPAEDERGAAALDRLTAAGTRVRAYVPDHDDAAVVEVLAAAYDGTDDGGWDRTRFAERRGLPWFRPEDLLVAQDPDGHLAGIHWLKRRGGGVGEVYNLAVHPRAQGRGAGPALLRAGLDHLDAVGCTEVLLWVDTANERAVHLYRAQGFRTRWEDVAVGTALP